MALAYRNLFIQNTNRLLKIEKKLFIGKAHWLIARPSPSRSHVAHFFAKYRALRGIQILEFSSPHIILNREYIDYLRP